MLKSNNIYFIKNPGGDRERGTENLLEEITAENFTNLGEGKRYPDPGGTKNHPPRNNQPQEVQTKVKSSDKGRIIFKGTRK